MKETIEKVEIILSELGYNIFDREESEDMYHADFGRGDETIGTYFLETDNNFLEIANSYSFDLDEESFLKEHLESMMSICYEYGSYFNIIKSEDEINFSVFSKIYLSGLNLESAQETLEDFIACNQDLMSLFDLEDEENGTDFDELYDSDDFYEV